MALLEKDQSFFSEWFKGIGKIADFQDFYNNMLNEMARTNRDWTLKAMDMLQAYFKIPPQLKSLQDFNLVQTRSDRNTHQKHLRKLLADEAENSQQVASNKFTDHIISTLYGFILRKEAIQEYVADLDEVIPEIVIS